MFLCAPAGMRPWIDENGDQVPALKDLKYDIGNMLNKAIAAVEEENDALAGVLKNNIDFNAVKGKTKIPDQKWKDLLDHFNQPQFVLVNDNFEFPDLLGAAYEYLIKFFADSAGKKGGEFYTPAEVVRLLVQTHQAGGRQRDLRPHRRFRRFPDPVSSVCGRAGAGPERSRPLRPGLQRHRLVDLQHEHDPPQHHPLHHRKRRHPGGPADSGKRPGAQVRPRARQSALLAELQPGKYEIPQPLPRMVPRNRQEGRPDVRAAHAGQPQDHGATWRPSCPTACSFAAARKS